MTPARHDDRVQILFTSLERDLILEHTHAEDAIAEQLREADSIPGGGFVTVGALHDLNELLESIAAAANHCEDRKLVSRLDRLYDRLEVVEGNLQDVESSRRETQAAGTKMKARPEKRLVAQFRIELLGIDPPIWRRIQVLEDASL